MSQRFIINDNDTVIDQSANLMWQRESSGAMSWEKAIKYCKSLRLGGYDDWRLPTIEELSCLADRSKINPAIDTTAFPNTMSSFYWSSTTLTNITNNAWGVDFYYGDDGHGGKSYTYYVRAVRGGKP